MPSHPENSLSQDRNPLIESINAAHQERRRRLRELEERMVLEMPTSEIKARLTRVVHQHSLLTQVEINAFEEFMLACLEMALTGEVNKAPGWSLDIQNDFDPVSQMKVSHLRAIGQNKGMREHIERIVEGVADTQEGQTNE